MARAWLYSPRGGRRRRDALQPRQHLADIGDGCRPAAAAGRASITTGSCSARAAASFAAVALPPEFFVTMISMRSSRSSASSVGQRERAAGADDLGVRRQRAARRIDRAHHVVVLRHRGEGGEVLLPDGEQHAPWRHAERPRRRCHVGNRTPVVAGCRDPGRAQDTQQGHITCAVAATALARHPRGERVRRVDAGRRTRHADSAASPSAPPKPPMRQAMRAAPARACARPATASR